MHAPWHHPRTALHIRPISRTPVRSARHFPGRIRAHGRKRGTRIHRILPRARKLPELSRASRTTAPGQAQGSRTSRTTAPFAYRSAHLPRKTRRLGPDAVKVLQGELVEVLVGHPALGQRLDVRVGFAYVAPGLAGIQRRKAELVGP